jgi:hypothetical protein
VKVNNVLTLKTTQKSTPPIIIPIFNAPVGVVVVDLGCFSFYHFPYPTTGSLCMRLWKALCLLALVPQFLGRPVDLRGAVRRKCVGEDSAHFHCVQVLFRLKDLKSIA